MQSGSGSRLACRPVTKASMEESMSKKILICMMAAATFGSLAGCSATGTASGSGAGGGTLTGSGSVNDNTGSHPRSGYGTAPGATSSGGTASGATSGGTSSTSPRY
ncbi:hypothetical protein LMG23994_05050 [Cupriavidus pinatubonensis]|uniref:Lipoprotein n=2 Tax=Cupriavidus pinatubonensis TaxID=248026 RepID=A0ABM8XRY1_9BURK|nr:hypothetical protein LMG23994_05050 [Cupriavidus pinatubonensis]